MIEYIDIVDENNNVIKAADRDFVHMENLLHRAVHIFIFNSKGELFLQKRKMTKQEHPGKLDSSAAGHLDAGESYDDAASRELEEELGVRVPLKEVTQIKACEETGNEFVYFYTGVSDNRININVDEIEEGYFMSPEEIKKRIKNDISAFTPAFLLIFNSYFGLTDL